jgi:hypothetical protein
MMGLWGWRVRRVRCWGLGDSGRRLLSCVGGGGWGIYICISEMFLFFLEVYCECNYYTSLFYFHFSRREEYNALVSFYLSLP